MRYEGDAGSTARPAPPRRSTYLSRCGRFGLRQAAAYRKRGGFDRGRALHADRQRHAGDRDEGEDLGRTGHEPRDQLDRDGSSRTESRGSGSRGADENSATSRRRWCRKSRWGRPQNGGSLATRSFIPHECHAFHRRLRGGDGGDPGRRCRARRRPKLSRCLRAGATGRGRASTGEFTVSLTVGGSRRRRSSRRRGCSGRRGSVRRDRLRAESRLGTATGGGIGRAEHERQDGLVITAIPAISSGAQAAPSRCTRSAVCASRSSASRMASRGEIQFAWKKAPPRWPM